MKISVFGAGYVGLVLSACLAEAGHHVICVEVNEKRLRQLEAGECPLYEKDLPELLRKVIASKKLGFCNRAEQAVMHGAVLFLAVGTPAREDGSSNLDQIFAAAESIGQCMTEYKLVVNKSTVPMGTAAKVNLIIQRALMTRNMLLDVDVASNPEFLKEGSAVADFQCPDRVVIGVPTHRSAQILRDVYAPFCSAERPLMVMDVASAELTKYVANAYLATKISFMNEMARLADLMNADIELVRQAVTQDRRIGPAFSFPGAGFGGSCFPKDLLSLTVQARSCGYEPEILNAVQAVNQNQKKLLFEKINHHFNGRLKDKVIALWGLAFKPGTDDIREASSGVLIDALLKRGAHIRAYDPQAMPKCREKYAEENNVFFGDFGYSILKNADALVLMTEWSEFKTPDFNVIKESLKTPVIFDGRNFFNRDFLISNGFSYYSIGRPEVIALPEPMPEEMA